MKVAGKQIKIDFIVSCLKQGQARGAIMTKFVKKWQMNVRTFDRYLNIAKGIAESISEKENKAVEAAYISGAEQMALNGIKTKSQRLLILQNEIDNCLSELATDSKLKHYADLAGKRTNVKQLTIIEKVKLRQVITQLQSEISKIQGDYAPDKSANQPLTININGKRIGAST